MSLYRNSENMRKEPPRFFPFFVYIYFVLYIASLILILGQGGLFFQGVFFVSLFSLVLFYSTSRSVIINKVKKLYKIFIFIALFKLFQETSGRLIVDFAVIEVYEDGLFSFFLLFLKLCSLALNAFLFVEILGESNVQKFIGVIFWPLGKLGFGESRNLSQLLIRAYDVFPLVLDVLKKGIKKNVAWVERELKVLLRRSNQVSDEKLSFCSVNFVYYHSFLLLFLIVSLLYN